MPEAWRIVKTQRAAGAFSGEGAAKFGGRWNSPGVSVVYASATQSLAALETLVHLNPQIRFSYCAMRVAFDAALVEKFALKSLPGNWRAEPPPLATKRIGDAWAREARSAVMALPSAIVPGEINYLLNPKHADFKKIEIGKPEDFAFDPRLFLSSR